MNRWIGKVAVVTGASAGIGAATVIDLVKSGMIVVGLARRVERIEALEKNIPKTATGKLYSKKCDVSNEDEVKCVFKWIEDTLGGVDVLVNNAAILTSVNTVAKDSSEAIRQTVNTNLLGTVWCIKAAYDSMLKRNVNGHIILINSILGHKVFQFANIMPSLNIYPATKHGVTALTEVLRQEMQMLGNKIKITVCFFNFFYVNGFYTVTV